MGLAMGTSFCNNFRIRARTGKGKGARGEVWPAWPVHDDDGTYLGCLKWGEQDQILCAHCLYREGEENTGPPMHGLCRANRTVKPTIGARQWQGRPIGFLIAWLRLARLHACRSKADHVAMQRDISFEDRLVARHWAVSTPSMAEALMKERPQRDDEDIEPEVMQ